MDRYRHTPTDTHVEAVRCTRPFVIIAEWCEGTVVRNSNSESRILGILLPNATLAAVDEWIVLDDQGPRVVPVEEFESDYLIDLVDE